MQNGSVVSLPFEAGRASGLCSLGLEAWRRSRLDGTFFISTGLLSHWQVWLAFAIATQLTAHHLAPIAEEHDDIILR